MLIVILMMALPTTCMAAYRYFVDKEERQREVTMQSNYSADLVEDEEVSNKRQTVIPIPTQTTSAKTSKMTELLATEVTPDKTEIKMEVIAEVKA